VWADGGLGETLSETQSETQSETEVQVGKGSGTMEGRKKMEMVEEDYEGNRSLMQRDCG